MASKNLPVADSDRNYKCVECFTPFPTRSMLIQHQNEDEPCRSSELIKNTLTPLSIPQPVLQPPNVEPNISSLALLSPTLPPPSPPPRVEPNASSHAPSPTLPPPLPSSVEPNTAIVAPSPTLPPYVAENATSYYHAYLMQEIMPIDAAAAAAAYDDDDHCSSPDNRTLDLISQLEPTRNFLCLIERQSAGQSGNAANVVHAAPGPSVEMGPLDLDFKL